MIKIIIISIIFLTNMNSVNARVLTITEVNEAYNNGYLHEIGENLSSTIDEENKTINIYDNSEKITSIKYTDEYIEYDNRDATFTLENFESYFSEMIYLAGLVQTIMYLSNPEGNDSLDDTKDYSNAFDTYGLQLETQPYEYSGTEDGEWKISGNYIKYLKMSLDTDKINALMDEYGTDEEENLITNLPIFLEAKNITENSVTLFPNISYISSNSNEKIYCNVYRSTSKDGTYEKITSNAIDCMDSNASIIDSGLKSDTTYYYKASIVSIEKYSDIIEVKTKKATVPAVNNVQNNAQNKEIENPKTGLFLSLITVLTMMIGSIGVLIYAKKKSQIENNVD